MPLAPTKIRTKKDKATKRNVVSETQPQSSKPSKPLKRKKEIDEGSEPTILKAEEPKKSSKKAKKDEAKPAKIIFPQPESSSVEEDEDEDDAGHLRGFSTDDDDSSDEEDAMDSEPSFDISKLPTIAKDDATVKQKLEKAKRQPVRLFSTFIESLFDSNSRQKTVASCSSGVCLTGSMKTNSRVTFHNSATLPDCVSLAIKK